MIKTQKVIFLDIDGTLITETDGPFKDDIREIEAAQKRGHLVFLNTGRSFAVIPAIFKQVSWIDGFVAGAGAHVLLADKNGQFNTIYHKWIPRELLPLVCDLYLGLGKWCIFEGETEIYGTIHESGTIMIENRDDFPTRFPGALISKITIEGYATEKEKAVLGEYFYLYPQNGYSEGIIKGESKSKGMQMVLDAVNIPKENTIAIGDSFNDLDMIRFARTGIAMGNACEELKQAADVITLECGKGGVAKALREWAQ